MKRRAQDKRTPLPLRERLKNPSPLAGEGQGRGVPDRKQAFAKRLRSNATDAESVLWRHLRAHRFAGHKFKRQHPIGPYIVDFVCFGSRLIIEVDGGQHLENERDAKRDAWLQAQGFVVVRVWNNDVLSRTEAVLDLLAERLPLSPNPSPARGEGSTKASENLSEYSQ
jgi:very-short-patch-repair endonuclease